MRLDDPIPIDEPQPGYGAGSATPAVAMQRRVADHQIAGSCTQYDGRLYLVGRMPARGVAIVGARAADAYGLALARRIAFDAVGMGFAVISGGAEGCDREAHEAAIEAGGATLVVLPAGHRHIYPEAHRGLFEMIVDRGGGVVSARPPDARPTRQSFLARNRLIARLSEAIVVVRARLRSGSLSTAMAARALRKPVGAVPGDVGQALSEGCHHLIATGAVPMLGPRSLSKMLGASAPGSGWPLRSTGQPAPWSDALIAPPAGLESHDQQVLSVVSKTPGLDLDAIAVQTNLPFELVVGSLMSLEVAGLVTRGPGGRYGPHH